MTEKQHIEDTIDTNDYQDLEAMIAELRRELAMRKNVYPKWVASGGLKPEKAAKQTGLLAAVTKRIVQYHAFLKKNDK